MEKPFSELSPDEQQALVERRAWEKHMEQTYARAAAERERANFERAENTLRQIARLQLGPEKSEAQVLAERAAAQRRCERWAKDAALFPRMDELDTPPWAISCGRIPPALLKGNE